MVNWNSILLQTIGNKVNVTLEVVDVKSAGGSMTVLARILDVPSGVNVGMITFGVIPSDEAPEKPKKK